MTQGLLSFEATHAAANVNRWYNVRAGTDLFGEWYVLSSWGRKGYKGGQKKEYGVISSEDVRKKVLSICKKRLNATSRIGCNYICTSHPLSLENINIVLNKELSETLHNF